MHVNFRYFYILFYILTDVTCKKFFSSVYLNLGLQKHLKMAVRCYSRNM
jgi:hypothetical protein